MDDPRQPTARAQPTGPAPAGPTSANIAVALSQIAPRLKQVRTRRRLTLTGVADTTGISKSTLSRLENGQRRPTLELILALSQAYRVPQHADHHPSDDAGPHGPDTPYSLGLRLPPPPQPRPGATDSVLRDSSRMHIGYLRSVDAHRHTVAPGSRLTARVLSEDPVTPFPLQTPYRPAARARRRGRSCS
jgi:transcriptional regulator with XRE-family HTH domain